MADDYPDVWVVLKIAGALPPMVPMITKSDG